MRSLADTTDLPLRATMLYFEPNKKGEVATMLAAEVVPPPGKAGERLFKLVSEARARDGGAPIRDQFEGVPSVTPGLPIVLSRQWHLPPGVWQVRLVVEDTSTGRIGTVVHTFEVPDAKAFRISTPILTAEIEDPEGKRKPKVALSRTFRSGTVLYCQYSVYNANAGGQARLGPARARVVDAAAGRRGRPRGAADAHPAGGRRAPHAHARRVAGASRARRVLARHPRARRGDRTRGRADGRVHRRALRRGCYFLSTSSTASSYFHSTVLFDDAS